MRSASIRQPHFLPYPDFTASGIGATLMTLL
jgi:hypothetical protein